MSDMNSTISQDSVRLISRWDFTALTPEIFQAQYQRTGTPVVLTGLLHPGCDWDLDYLCEKLGDRELLVRVCGRDRYQQDKRQWQDIGAGIDSQPMPFSRYAEQLRDRTAQEQDLYLAKYPLKGTPLSHDEPLQQVGRRLGLTKPTSDVGLWVGPTDHVEALHYDPVDVLLMQLHGTKKVVLFPPDQTANLYPFPLSVHLRHGLKLRSWCSQLYPERPDLESFPRFKEALQHRYEVTLNPGEVLYLPVGWWHEVTTIGDEMICSVNQTWSVRPTVRALRSWNRWRILLGAVFALPHTLLSVWSATFSHTSKVSLHQLSRRF